MIGRAGQPTLSIKPRFPASVSIRDTPCSKFSAIRLAVNRSSNRHQHQQRLHWMTKICLIRGTYLSLPRSFGGMSDDRAISALLGSIRHANLPKFLVIRDGSSQQNLPFESENAVRRRNTAR
jgi:hypothetical protein